jgi:hypothetical protein
MEPERFRQIERLHHAAWLMRALSENKSDET